jgi:C4-dicarboxylate-specific signal transduction histidine kinase
VFDPALVNTVIFTMIFITGILKYLAFPMLLLRKTDIEKQAQFAKTLARANKTVASGALAASIAHELNQPLASIRINGQVLRKIMDEQIDDKLAQPEQVRLMIEGILSENERAAKIIGSLRAIFSQNTVSPAQTDSANQIQKVVALVGQGMDKHQIRLEQRLQKNLLVTMPEDEFQQVISNLLLNSMQALKEQASTQEKVILIESGIEGGQVFIAVSDNGPGVSKDMQDMLFNILSTTKDSGMGVGLWLCMYMVERYHGTLEHGSARLGGATFVLRLSPAAAPQEGLASPATTEALGAVLARLSKAKL